MNARGYLSAARVNCRVGSLEIGTKRIFGEVKVNCRVGSLEIKDITIGG